MKISGDKANKATPWTGILDVGHPLEFSGATKISNGIDELFGCAVDKSKKRDSGKKGVDPTENAAAWFVGNGQAQNKEQGKGYEEPEEVVSGEVFDFPRGFRSGSTQSIETGKDKVNDCPANVMKEFEDQNDNPTGSKNRDDGSHSSEEGLEGRPDF